MNKTMVVFKDGRTASGAIWDWCPVLGFFSLMGDAGGPPLRVYLGDISSAITKLDRDFYGADAADVDILERARGEGWRPPVPGEVK